MTLYEYCIANKRPELLSEWDHAQNGDVTPESVSSGSGKSYFWRCNQGHTWSAPLNSRTNPGIQSGCPYCAGKKPILGKTDLASQKPTLAAEWANDLNEGLLPADVTVLSNKKVWWRCSLGHTWQARVADRVMYDNNCPYCANRMVLTGFNDLATVAPELAAEWNYEKNGDRTPENTLFGSRSYAWWKCALGHEWRATIDSRYQKKCGCPYCTNRKLLVGFNDLATTVPRLAKEWHPFMNGDLTPQMFTRGNNQRIWWLCSEGHVWRAQIKSRGGVQQTGCPVCNGCVSAKRQRLYDRILVEAKYNKSKEAAKEYLNKRNKSETQKDKETKGDVT